MAALINLRQMPVLQRCLWNHINHMNKVSRTISTSKKNSDDSSPSVVDDKKVWVSYGFDYEDQKEDTHAHHSSFFFSVTLCMVFGGFLWAYAPDVHMRDWVQREAFLELRRREERGEPPISPDYISPTKMTLPTDEELGDIEIII